MIFMGFCAIGGGCGLSGVWVESGFRRAIVILHSLEFLFLGFQAEWRSSFSWNILS